MLIKPCQICEITNLDHKNKITKIKNKKNQRHLLNYYVSYDGAFWCSEAGWQCLTDKYFKPSA